MDQLQDRHTLFGVRAQEAIIFTTTFQRLQVSICRRKIIILIWEAFRKVKLLCGIHVNTRKTKNPPHVHKPGECFDVSDFPETLLWDPFLEKEESSSESAESSDESEDSSEEQGEEESAEGTEESSEGEESSEEDESSEEEQSSAEEESSKE